MDRSLKTAIFSRFFNVAIYMSSSKLLIIDIVAAVSELRVCLSAKGAKTFPGPD